MSHSDSLLLLIMARKGSKGLPGKNLMEIGGIPLIGRAAWTARRAANTLAPMPCRVICSTDGDELARAAREWGAETPFLRPAALASDTSSSADAALHAFEAAGGNFSGIVLLQPTSPFTEVEDVLEVVKLFLERRRPVVSVTRLEHPVEWAHELCPDGSLKALRPGKDGLPQRRQDCIAAFIPNGAIYATTPEELRRSRSFLSGNPLGYEMPAERSLDIDNVHDLELARGLAGRVQPAPIFLGTRGVGTGHPCFIIAEAGVNHNGDMDMAMRLIDAAADAGADAVKFQTFKAEKLVSKGTRKAAYQTDETGGGSMDDMIRKLELKPEQHGRLLDHAKQRGILFLSTPFDEDSLDFLVSLGLVAIKLGSGEVTNAPLLKKAARTGLPLIVSSGMSELFEVAQAVDWLKRHQAGPFAILHCVSNYPAKAETLNLKAMETLRNAFRVPVGYSDHSVGLEAPWAAVAMGAAILERHMTLDRTLPGPDHKASTEPDEFRRMVEGIRTIEIALGDGTKRMSASEAEVREVARRSLVIVRNLEAGHILAEGDLMPKRPSTGISPFYFDQILGRRIRQALPADTVLEWAMLE